MLAGILGGLQATWVTVGRCFVWIFVGAPSSKCCATTKSFNGVLTAITASVVGVVLNLAVWYALHTVFRAWRVSAI